MIEKMYLETEKKAGKWRTYFRKCEYQMVNGVNEVLSQLWNLKFLLNNITTSRDMYQFVKKIIMYVHITKFSTKKLSLA